MTSVVLRACIDYNCWCLPTVLQSLCMCLVFVRCKFSICKWCSCSPAAFFLLDIFFTYLIFASSLKSVCGSVFKYSSPWSNLAVTCDTYVIPDFICLVVVFSCSESLTVRLHQSWQLNGKLGTLSACFYQRNLCHL